MPERSAEIAPRDKPALDRADDLIDDGRGGEHAKLDEMENRAVREEEPSKDTEPRAPELKVSKFFGVLRAIGPALIAESPARP